MIAYRAEAALVGLLRPHLAIEDRLLHHQRRGGDAAALPDASRLSRI